MNISVVNQKTKIKLDRKISEKIKESNEKHLVNLCESNNFESHTSSTSLIPVNATNSNELARTLFPVLKVQNK